MTTREDYLTIMMWILFIALQVTTRPVSIIFVTVVTVFILAEVLVLQFNKIRTWIKNRKTNND